MLTILAALTIGLGLLAYAWIEMAPFRAIARRRQENGTRKATTQIWKPL